MAENKDAVEWGHPYECREITGDGFRGLIQCCRLDHFLLETASSTNLKIDKLVSMVRL